MFGRYIWARAKGNSLSRVRAALVSAVILGALSFVVPRDARGQCGGMATSPASLADCAMRNLPIDKVAELDPAHVYSLAELIEQSQNAHCSRFDPHVAASGGLAGSLCLGRSAELNPRYAEYTQHTIGRYLELRSIVVGLETLA
jgi:hypothetical protein